MITPTRKTLHVALPAFSGPLDLLLHLIERNELDITALSLVLVCEQYLEQVEKLKEDKVAQLVDFMVVGARLLVIKSRALLPQISSVAGSDEELEDPAESLARQLREYRRFKEAALWFAKRESGEYRTYLRISALPPPEVKPDLAGIDLDTLRSALIGALTRAANGADISAAQGRRSQITIERQISRLRRSIQATGHVYFKQLLSEAASLLEISLTLLAVLELMKQHEIDVRQPVPFGPIEIIQAERSGSEPPMPAPSSSGSSGQSTAISR
jgi:segregation and condensation protein A